MSKTLFSALAFATLLPGFASAQQLSLEQLLQLATEKGTCGTLVPVNAVYTGATTVTVTCATAKAAGAGGALPGLGGLGGIGGIAAAAGLGLVLLASGDDGAPVDTTNP